MRSRCVGAVTAVLLLTGGCTNAQIDGAPSTPARPLHHPMLDHLTATPDSLVSISLIDSAAMVQLARKSGLSDGTNEWPTMNEWAEGIGVASPCDQLIFRADRPTAGRVGISISVSLGDVEHRGTVSACAPSLAHPEKYQSSTDLTKKKMGPIDGTLSGSTWAGNAKDGTTYFVHDEPPQPLVEQALSSVTAAEPIANDPGVRAVLDAAPGAALAQLGTGVGKVSKYEANLVMLDVFHQMIDKRSFGVAPVQTFGGYAWIPGPQVRGTGVFVTTYGSTDEAATAATILNDTWAALGVSRFSSAVTVQREMTVVTTLPDVDSAEISYVSGKYGGYPGFFVND